MDDKWMKIANVLINIANIKKHQNDAESFENKELRRFDKSGNSCLLLPGCRKRDLNSHGITTTRT